MLIDSHCHLYSEEFLSDRDAVIQRAIDAGVQKFYLPAIDSETTAAMLSWKKLTRMFAFAWLDCIPVM